MNNADPKPRPGAQLKHLTPEENLPAILKEGLAANDDGEIFAYTDDLVADTIAKNQVFTKRYAVLLIDPAGVTGNVVDDNVSEFSAGYQRIITQKRIGPQHLRHTGTFDVVTARPTAWDYIVGVQVYGWTEEQVDDHFACCSKLRVLASGDAEEVA